MRGGGLVTPAQFGMPTWFKMGWYTTRSGSPDPADSFGSCMWVDGCRGFEATCDIVDGGLFLSNMEFTALGGEYLPINGKPPATGLMSLNF